ncbi:MAG TPA: 2-oxo-tetronate isomerase [Burkholderiaceae bacterium]|nr:2-oxo-tetronate isomerase [Burkholderiaceae bacterium]
MSTTGVALKFAANLSLLYPEHEFLDRYAAAAADGFMGVEMLFPYAWPKAELAARLKDHGLEQVLFNAPPGDAEKGERGTASLPGRTDEFRAGVEQALIYAEALGCRRIHVMAGISQGGEADTRQHATYLENLDWAARQAAAEGRNVLIEPINQRDMPGYFLKTQAQAHAIVQELGHDNLNVQMDLYHCQIAEGDIETRLRAYLPTGRVGHMQIAGVPHRHEPDLGELNYPHLFQVIQSLQYEGWIGCEYRPAGDTSSGLNWLRQALDQALSV